MLMELDLSYRLLPFNWISLTRVWTTSTTTLSFTLKRSEATKDTSPASYVIKEVRQQASLLESLWLVPQGLQQLACRCARACLMQANSAFVTR